MKNYLLFAFLFSQILGAKAIQIPTDPYLRGKAIDSIYNVYAFHAEFRARIEKDLLQQAKKNNDKELKALVEVLRFTLPMTENFRVEIEKFSEFPNIQAKAYEKVSFYFFNITFNYEKAFDAFIRLERLLEMHGPKIITDYANYCSRIGTAYYKFKNYKKTIDISKKGLEEADNRWDFYNTIGMCYKELNKMDSSFYYLKKAVDEVKRKDLPYIYRTISLGTIGSNYYVLKQYKKAKPLVEIDIEGALKWNDHGLAAGGEIILADILLSEGNLKSADILLKKARKHIQTSEQLNRLEKFFPIQSKYYHRIGQQELALAYSDSTISAINRNDSTFNSLLLMRVQQRNDLGKIAEEKTKLVNYQKLSQTRLLAVIIIFSLIIVVFALVRRYRNQIKQDKERIQELSQLLALRQRLSADMHDDIGSTLSSISLYTHSLLLQPQTDVQKSTLEKIKNSAQNVQESVSDIIWSVNPNMDVMEQVIARMRAFGADMTEHANIAFEFEVDDEVKKLHFDMVTRRNLYLVYKESINNAVKYSECNQITVKFTYLDSQFNMEIIDNGKGFDVEKKWSGNGLRNLQRRADEINAKLLITSSEPFGTTVSFTIPVNN